MAVDDYRKTITLKEKDIVDVITEVAAGTIDVNVGVSNVHTNTLPAGSQATATVSVDNNQLTFTFGVPKGDKGDKGDRGNDGSTGTINGGRRQWAMVIDSVKKPNDLEPGTEWGASVNCGNKGVYSYPYIIRDVYGRIEQTGGFKVRYDCACDCSTGND